MKTDASWILFWTAFLPGLALFIVGLVRNDAELVGGLLVMTVPLFAATMSVMES